MNQSAIEQAIKSAQEAIPAFANRIDSRITIQELAIQALDRKLDFIISLLVASNEEETDQAIEQDALKRLQLQLKGEKPCRR
jgi:hypothetical protein